MRSKGLEPPRLSALDPKSSAATNYATTAGGILITGAKVVIIFKPQTIFLEKIKYFFTYRTNTLPKQET